MRPVHIDMISHRSKFKALQKNPPLNIRYIFFQFYAWEKGLCQMSSTMSKKSTLTIKMVAFMFRANLSGQSQFPYPFMAIGNFRTKEEIQTWLATMRRHMFFSGLGASISDVGTFFRYFNIPSPISTVFWLYPWGTIHVLRNHIFRYFRPPFPFAYFQYFF